MVYQRMILLFLIMPVLTGLLAAKRSAAQVHSGVTFFQTVIVDPYSQALGEATVALRGYPGAASVNPATIGRSNTIQFGSNVVWDSEDGGVGGHFHTPWLPGGSSLFDDFWLASPAGDVRFRRWAFAYQYKEFNLGEFEIRDAQNNPLGIFTARDRSQKVSVAYDLQPNLTVGVGMNLIQIKRVNVAVGRDPGPETTVSLDLGVVYDLAFDVPYARVKPSLGWSLTDFGRPVRFEDASPGDPLTMVMRGGLSLQAELKEQWLRRPILTVGLHGNLSKYMVGFDRDEDESGFVEFVPYGPFEALVKTWKPIEVRTGSLNAEEPEFTKVGVLDQLFTHVGLDLSLLKILTLRWGDIDEPEYLGTRHYNTFGFGVDLFYVALDYSKASSDDTAAALGGRSPFDGMTYWRLTARIPLKKSPDNFWPVLLDELRR